MTQPQAPGEKVIVTQYMDFVLIGRKPKTNVWAVMNKSSGFRLGVIQWYGPWRQYVFSARANSVFSKGCMEDIVKFIKEEAPHDAD